MSLKEISTTYNKDPALSYTSNNHKAVQSLQNISYYSKTTTNGNIFTTQHKAYARTKDECHKRNTSMNNNDNQLNQYVCSYEEDLDFNLGFDQTSSINEIEVDFVNELDQNENNQQENQNSNMNNGNRSYYKLFKVIHCYIVFILDISTLLELNGSSVDTRINELELSSESYTSTSWNGKFNHNNDKLIICNKIEEQQNTSLLRDSTSSLCSQCSFPFYVKDYTDNNGDNNIQQTIVKRSKSLNIAHNNRKSTLLDKPPKKFVRFADMMVSFVYQMAIR